MLKIYFPILKSEIHRIDKIYGLYLLFTLLVVVVVGKEIKQTAWDITQSIINGKKNHSTNPY